MQAARSHFSNSTKMGLEAGRPFNEVECLFDIDRHIQTHEVCVKKQEQNEKLSEMLQAMLGIQNNCAAKMHAAASINTGAYGYRPILIKSKRTKR